MIIFAYTIILISNIAFIGYCSSVIIKKMDAINKEEIKRQIALEQWLFKSLYSMNHNVLLPDEVAVALTNKKPTVYVPRDNPMGEFDGTMEDEIHL